MKSIQPLLRIQNLFKQLDKRWSGLVRNSFWGVVANIIQNLLFSLFFIVLARVYSVNDFANYIMANTVYGMIVSFSSLGLGQWFLREVLNGSGKQELIGRYFKVQIYLGLIFYLFHLVVCFLLYSDGLLRSLSILIGINILFDNIIYVIKHVNIAEENQRKTFFILTVEALLKAISALILFLIDIPIIYLAFLLILLRLITLNLFIHFGSSGMFTLNSMLRTKINLNFVYRLLRQNWSFVLIGSISVIYWKLGVVFVSKFLTGQEVVDYEISYKLFSMAEILPFIVSSSVFPVLMRTFKENKTAALELYRNAFILYALYGLMTYTFIFSYADTIVPFLFGSKFAGTSVYCKEMFLTILVFPTALLQANMLIVMGLEKTDMWLNLISLVLHTGFCLFVLQYFPSLSVINYSILISFVVFHLFQDFLFFRKNIIGIGKLMGFYILLFIFIAFYTFLSRFITSSFLFPLFWLPMLLFFYVKFLRPVFYFKPRTLPQP